MTMKRLISIFMAACLVLVISACGAQGSKEIVNHDEKKDNTTSEEAGHGDHGGTEDSGQAEEAGHGEHGGTEDGGQAGSSDAGVQAKWTFSQEKPKAGEETKVTIRIEDKEGKAIDKFDINHEKKLHLIVVNKDLSFFSHVHPQEQGGGAFDIPFEFPAGGDYQLIADFIPTGLGSTTLKEWVNVDGDQPASQPLKPQNDALTTVVDGKEVTLTIDHLMAGMETNLTFTLKDEKTKEPITNLQPYLGAVGHVVIIDEKVEQYLHVHPLEEKSTGPEAKFMTEFPNKGMYKIWGQFQQDGNVFTVPFVVNVP